MKRLTLLFSLSLLMHAYCENSFAQEYTVEQYELGEVVVTGSRTQMLIDDSPSAMTVITAEEIRRMGVSNVYDAIVRTASITPATGADRAHIGIRGSSEQEVLFLLNGRNIAAAEDSKGRKQRSEWLMQTLNINSVERIEIMRGNASAIYGAEASAGVINIITKQAGESQTTLGAVVSNYGVNTYFSHDFGQIGNWDAIFNANYSYQFGLRQEPAGVNGEDVEGAYIDYPEGPSANFMLDMGYAINDNHELRLFSNIMYTDTYSYNFVPQIGTEPESLTRKGGTNTRLNAVLSYMGTVGSHDYMLSMGYDYLMVDEYDQKAPPFSLIDEYHISLLTLEARDTWYLNDYNTLTFGGSFKLTDISSEDIQTIWNTQGISNTTEFALYFQDEIALFDDRLLLIPSIRYDYYSTFGGHFSPRLAMTLHLNEYNRFKASVGTSFVPPDTERLYSNTASTQGNPNLQPEESIGYEFRYEFDYNNLFAAATYFYTDYSQTIDQYKVSGVRYYRNIGASTHEGIELELSYTFLENFTLTTSYLHSNFTIESTGLPSIGNPENVFTAGLSYFNPEWDFSASVYARIVDDQLVYIDDEDNPQHVVWADYNSVSLSLSKTWLDKYSLTFSVDNLFYTYNAASSEFLDPTQYTLAFEMRF